MEKLEKPSLRRILIDQLQSSAILIGCAFGWVTSLILPESDLASMVIVWGAVGYGSGGLIASQHDPVYEGRRRLFGWVWAFVLSAAAFVAIVATVIN